MDGELTLRPAQRVSSQIEHLVRLFLVRSEEKPFRSIARLDGRRWLPPRRACALDTWGCNPGTKNTTHQERSANPGEAPGKLTFGLVPRLWRFFGEVLLARRAHGMTNRHTQPSRAPARQTKRMTAKVLIATRADHAELRRVGTGGSCCSCSPNAQGTPALGSLQAVMHLSRYADTPRFLLLPGLAASTTSR